MRDIPKTTFESAGLSQPASQPQTICCLVSLVNLSLAWEPMDSRIYTVNDARGESGWQMASEYGGGGEEEDVV